jgi:hypothetical protein
MPAGITHTLPLKKVMTNLVHRYLISFFGRTYFIALIRELLYSM